MKRIVSLLLCVIIFVTTVASGEIVNASEGEANGTYISEKYKVEHSIVNRWGGYCIEQIKLTNTSDECIYNWSIMFNSNDLINDIWGASVYKYENDIYIYYLTMVIIQI